MFLSNETLADSELQNISQDEALSRVGPIVPAIVECATAALRATRQARRVFINQYRSTDAKMLSSAFEDAVRSRMATTVGVHLREKDGRFMICFGGLVLHFKKVDHDYRSSNLPTASALAFGRQLPLAGVPLQPRITIAYRLRRYEFELEDLALVFAVGRSVRWTCSLAGTAQVEQLPLSGLATTDVAATAQNRRVRARGVVVTTARSEES